MCCDHVITCLSAFGTDKCVTGHLSMCASPEVQPDDSPGLATKEGDAIHQFLNLSSFAEMMLIHEHALVKVREDMPMDRAALIGCSTTTGVGAVYTAGVEPGSTVVVIGCGGVGLAINGAAIAVLTTIAVDRVDSKLELAKSVGATHVVNAAEKDAVGEVKEMTEGGCDYAFEAIGFKATAAILSNVRARRNGHSHWHDLWNCCMALIFIREENSGI